VSPPDAKKNEDRLGPLRDRVPDGAVFVDLEVPFHDVDLLRVAWHGHYFKYFELARTALQRAHRLDVPDLHAIGTAWFVVDTRTRHVSPLRYGEKFRVYAWFFEDDPRIGIAYEIRSHDGDRKVARARTVLVSTTKDGEMLFETPKEVRDRIRTR
jgi:acyl-CoA thioester hydrolase